MLESTLNFSSPFTGSFSDAKCNERTYKCKCVGILRINYQILLFSSDQKRTWKVFAMPCQWSDVLLYVTRWAVNLCGLSIAFNCYILKIKWGGENFICGLLEWLFLVLLPDYFLSFSHPQFSPNVKKFPSHLGKLNRRDVNLVCKMVLLLYFMCRFCTRLQSQPQLQPQSYFKRMNGPPKTEMIGCIFEPIAIWTFPF